MSTDLTAETARALRRAALEREGSMIAQAENRGAAHAEHQLPAILRAIENTARNGGGFVDLIGWAPTEQPAAFYDAYYRHLWQLLQNRGFRRLGGEVVTWLDP